MGRVATLVKANPRDRVYGVVYEIDKHSMDKTFEHLNFREKCGYSLNEIEFQALDESVNSGRPLNCVCYFATEANAYYSPQTDLALVSYQIFTTRGPSGENREYLYMLCKALRELAVQHFRGDNTKIDELLRYDEHLFELEKLVLGLDAKERERKSPQGNNFASNMSQISQ
jgi:cation transport regulator ChaC